MKTLVCLIALAVAGIASAQAPSIIPPNVTTVVTTCGKPVAVYVTTLKGFLAYDGPVAVQMAKTQPYNTRVETGCKK